MDNKLQNLLDNIYELEGLVTLAIKRDDSQKEFLRIIAKKGKEIGNTCATLQYESSSSQQHVSEKLCEDDASCDITVSDNQDKQESINSEISSFENSDSTSFYLNEYSISDESEYNNLDSDISNNEEISDSEEVLKIVSSSKERGKLVFSINEKFRFRKELFDNSDVDFNNTLALVASMDSYDEAEDYFVNEEGFDPENPVVAEFLTIIRRYFQ